MPLNIKTVDPRHLYIDDSGHYWFQTECDENMYEDGSGNYLHKNTTITHCATFKKDLIVKKIIFEDPYIILEMPNGEIYKIHKDEFKDTNNIDLSEKPKNRGLEWKVK